jgi:hypothetical protein
MNLVSLSVMFELARSARQTSKCPVNDQIATHCDAQSAVSAIFVAARRTRCVVRPVVSVKRRRPVERSAPLERC